MRKLRAPWLALAAVASALSVWEASAQSDSETVADFRACAAIERESARLACFDGVAARAPMRAEPAPAARSDDVASAVAAPTPANASPAPANAFPATATAPPAPANASPATATAPDGPRMIRVVEVRTLSPTEAVFITDNGEAWEQTSGRRGRYPPTPFEAQLESGSLGSTFLVSPLGGPSVRVTLRD